MRVVCTQCSAELNDDPEACPECGGTEKGYTFGSGDIQDGRISAPEGFFVEKDQLPDWYRWSSWLWEDEEHQQGAGISAYRVVFKTVRIPILGTLNMTWPNLTMRMWHGSVRIGRATVDPALPWRREGHSVVPEWGTLSDTATGVKYEISGASSPTLGAEDEEFTNGSFVEFILQTSPGKPNEQVAEGRQKLASLMTMIDLSFGRRLRGMQLTEEIGEVFSDGHFICSTQSTLIGMESLMMLEPRSVPHELLAWSQSVIGRHMSRPDEERVTLGLASEWYLLAEGTIDPVLEFIYLWLAIEVLAMPNTSDIRPVRERLAHGLGGTENDWRDLVGPLFGRRSDIVHGNPPKRGARRG